MNTGELLLRHARVDERVQHLGAEIERLEAALASNPRLEQARARLEEARSAQREAAQRLRESEREVEGHRARMRDRDRELMSGRIHNPTELTKLSTEVQHMKERLSVEEDAELELMEEVEARDEAVRRAELEAQRVQAESDASAPELRGQLEKARLDLGLRLRGLCRYIGTATNNRAEYLALIEGLRAAQEWKPDRLEVFMDSKLVVEQLAGRYRIKNKDLQPLVRSAQELLASFPEVVIAHVERARNKGADALANRAIDEYRAK